LASRLSIREQFARRIVSGDASLRLYAILDAESCARRGLQLVDVASAWRDRGVCLLQYRDKTGSDDDVLRATEAIANAFRSEYAILLLNDRVHLLERSGWDGVHVGQGDMPVSVAREQVGDNALIGLSTHTPEQAESAGREEVDYVAVGPVFATATKLNAEPVVGLCGLQAVRALVRKPLVAIGGIGLHQARQVRASGADSVALISALLPADVDGANGLKRVAQDFLLALQ
jgi:thiamine-phosphate pyrophosphorylase